MTKAEANALRVTAYMATVTEVREVERAAKRDHRSVAQWAAKAIREALEREKVR